MHQSHEANAYVDYKSLTHSLRRHVLPPGLHNIAFVGQLATFQHVLTTALQVGGGWGA